MSDAGNAGASDSSEQQVSATTKNTLNPAQQQVLDELGAKERPEFRPELREELRHELESALAPMIDEIEDPPLFVSKRKLSMVHGCEGRFVAEEMSEFEWNVPAARGTVAHKAIELLVGWTGTPSPLELVKQAMDRLEADEFKSIAMFLQSLSQGERAELTGLVNDYVTTFTETFPPLRAVWKPVAESRVRAELCGEHIAMQGVVDLSLGFARGNEAGKVLIDLKSGRPHRSHVDDLRFYALLEMLKIGTPPRLLVNYYLEAGDPRSELVTEDLLWSTSKRVVDAVQKMVELQANAREPELQASSSCRFCPARDSCEVGYEYLNKSEEDDTIDT